MDAATKFERVFITAKRAEIATDVRARAADQNGMQQTLTLLDAYMYDLDSSAWVECDRQVVAYVKQLKALSAEDLTQRQQEVLSFPLEIRPSHGILLRPG